MKAKKLVITRLVLPTSNDGKEEESLVTASFEHDKMVEIDVRRKSDVSLIGNIYIGKVQNIVKNVNAAFIDINKDMTGFYSLEDFKNPVFARRIGKSSLCTGDEILVQVVKDPIKTKDAVLSTNLNFSGKYLVLTLENHTLGISSKVSKEQRIRFKSLFSEQSLESFGIVVRTNAIHATDEQIYKELEELKEIFHQTVSYAKNRTTYSLLYEAKKDEYNLLKEVNWEEIDEIVTDEVEIYNRFIHSAKELEQNLLFDKIRFYEDKQFSLAKLYNIEKQLERALNTHVWLNSGAYLVIEQTEALTVIDVNSGKNTSKKSARENQLKINLEAAKEIALQLRLRNISGICIIDFISMDEKDSEKILLQELSNDFKQDKVPTQLIDITKLGLVEVTRKKVRKSLLEQIYTKKKY